MRANTVFVMVNLFLYADIEHFNNLHAHQFTMQYFAFIGFNLHPTKAFGPGCHYHLNGF